jgi:hypothetical protein
MAAVRFYQESLDLARATNDPEGMAMALSGLTVLATFRQDGEQAVVLARESLERARATGDPWLIGHSLHIQGLAVRHGGDGQRAASLFQESLTLLRPVGDRWSMFYALVNLGGAAQARGDYEAARSAYQEALVCNYELRNRLGIALLLECLAEVAVAQDRHQPGARLMGAAERLLELIGASWPPPYVASRERTQATLCAALGDTAFAAARNEGRALPLAEAVRYALEAAPASA